MRRMLHITRNYRGPQVHTPVLMVRSQARGGSEKGCLSPSSAVGGGADPSLGVCGFRGRFTSTESFHPRAASTSSAWCPRRWPLREGVQYP